MLLYSSVSSHLVNIKVQFEEMVLFRNEPGTNEQRVVRDLADVDHLFFICEDRRWDMD